MDPETKTLATFKTPISIGRYSLLIKSVHTHWRGHGSDKMEDMPGDFFETNVFLKTIQDSDRLESLALEVKVNILEQYREIEITSQPEGYAKLLHRNRVKELQERPQDYYTTKIQSAVKEKL